MEATVKTLRVILLALTAACYYLWAGFALFANRRVFLETNFTIPQNEEWLVSGALWSLLVSTVLAVICLLVALVTFIHNRKATGLGDFLGVVPFFFKLLMIPYFVVTFAVGVFSSGFTALVNALFWWMGVPLGLAVVVGVAIALLTIVNYLALLATSAFAIAGILTDSRLLKVPFGLRVLFVILQLVFMVDVVSLPFIRRYLKHRRLSRLSGLPVSEVPGEPSSL
jgi:hypothetical protein